MKKVLDLANLFSMVRTKALFEYNVSNKTRTSVYVTPAPLYKWSGVGGIHFLEKHF